MFLINTLTGCSFLTGHTPSCSRTALIRWRRWGGAAVVCPMGPSCEFLSNKTKTRLYFGVLCNNSVCSFSHRLWPQPNLMRSASIGARKWCYFRPLRRKENLRRTLRTKFRLRSTASPHPWAYSSRIKSNLWVFFLNRVFVFCCFVYMFWCFYCDLCSVFYCSL